MSLKYQTTIGLEIHAQLKTKSKMFCSCKNDAQETIPNKNVCPVCLGHPGTLPVANKKAIKMVLKVGNALGSKLAKKSKFDRKNYFYPDLPKGYQISQYDKPLCYGGKLNKVKLTRIHLEEDTGRLVHKGDKSLIDFNRSGIPLMELVTEPDITSGKQAKKFCKDLQQILRYLNVSNANMEKGQMRCEVNISLALKNSNKLGTKVEIKNLNSFKAVEQAIDYEIKRQSKILDQGKAIVQETRGWQKQRGQTLPQRSKEQAHDYRYFPEPDLPQLNLKKLIKNIKVPELPKAKKTRFLDTYNLPSRDVKLLIKNKKLADFFENMVSELPSKKLIKLATNYLLKVKTKFKKITPENFAELISLINKGKISSSAADIVLKEMAKTGGDPSHIIEEKNLKQLSKSNDLKPIIKKVVEKNKKAIKDYRSGKTEVLGFLVGQIMAATKGKANPQVSKKLLIDYLASK